MTLSLLSILKYRTNIFCDRKKAKVHCGNNPMEDQGLVRQPLLKNGHVGTMDDKDTEGDLTFEDTPAYVALRDVLETR